MQVYDQSISAVCGIDWPRDRLLIQVLDDSDDESIQWLIKTAHTPAQNPHKQSHRFKYYQVKIMSSKFLLIRVTNTYRCLNTTNHPPILRLKIILSIIK